MMTEQDRRATDKFTSLDIEQMILNENDTKQRAFLIVLHSINRSLIANTETIREVSDKLETHLTNFEEHAKEEEALMNRGRGAWRVAAWVLGIVQIIGLGIWTSAREDISGIHAAIEANKIRFTEISVRLDNVEKRLK